MRFSVLSFIFVITRPMLEANLILGALQLDSLTINKTIFAYPFTLVKFDTGFPSGPKHEVWREVANELSEVEDIIVGEVRIKEYGDKFNEDMVDRFNISRDDLPEIVLFIRTKFNNYKSYQRYNFGGEVTAEGIKDFVKAKAKIELSLPGCLRTFDEFAENFIMVLDKDRQKKVLMVAEDALEAMTSPEDKAKAEKYIKLMKSVLDNGPEVLKKEKERLLKMMKEQKMSQAKRNDLIRTLNIIKSFVSPRQARFKDEF